MSLIRRLASIKSEAGSQTIEYGLVVILAATIGSLALAWARKGAVTALLDAMLKQVRSMFGIG
jgi:hypothetical protein